MFSGQSEASITIGASIALAGIIGTPLGGWLLDLEVTRRWVRKKVPSPNLRAVRVTISDIHTNRQ